ncbi:hypothetical protein KEM56_000201 [Ascosphaera pollenicola]|nr:hypothetical protein KEM56_000201 [Ascosphaera pollenicola]
MPKDEYLNTCIAGAFAALSIDLIVYPFDTLRTRLQAPDYAKRFTNQATGAVNRAVLFRGLYQGVGAAALAMIPSSGAFFVTYNSLNSVLKSSRKAGPLSGIPVPVLHAASSSIAEAVSCAILTPAEVLKQNAQMLPSSSSSKSSTVQAFQHLRKQPVHLWRGYIAMLSRNLPTTGINFPLFEIFRGRLAKQWHWRQGRTESVNQYNAVDSLPLFQRTTVAALSAALSGSIAAFIVTPIDVVKTRTMLRDEGSPKETRVRKGMLGTLRQVYIENGLRGLFRGASLRSAWAAFGTGLYLSTYEWARTVLQSDEQDA